MMKFWQNKALTENGLYNTVLNTKRHSQPRLDAKDSFEQEEVKYMAKRSFLTENNVKPSLEQKEIIVLCWHSE